MLRPCSSQPGCSFEFMGHSIPSRDFGSLECSARDVLDAYVAARMVDFANPCFPEEAIGHTSTTLLVQLVPVLGCVTGLELAKQLARKAWEHASEAWPERCDGPTTAAGRGPGARMQRKLDALRAIPQPAQRTPEWYAFRQRYLTASSAWKAFGTEASRNHLIYDKCAPMDVTKYTRVSVDTPMHWGQKYEDVSIAWYERSYSTTVEDFGCIPHPTLACLAASPDGINVSPGPRCGRMVEVKNIFNRKITGVPKIEYWIQMQLQMEVCDLDDCDFLETRFIEYESKTEADADGTFNMTANGKPKGVVMYFADECRPLYEYSPWGVGADECAAWEGEMMKKHKGLTWVKNLYWYLDEVSCVLVRRHRQWFEAAEPILTSLWATIERERVTGYAHRAPKRKQPPAAKVPAPRVCLIDTTHMGGDAQDGDAQDGDAQGGDAQGGTGNPNKEPCES